MSCTTTKCTYEGAICFEFEDKDYEANVWASADYYYQPCVMYFKDGTGQPECEEFDIDELEISKVYCVDTDEDVTERFNTDEKFKKEVECLVTDELYEMDSDEWSTPEDKEELEWDDYLDMMEEERHFSMAKS